MLRRFEHAGRTADAPPPAAVAQENLDEALIEARVAERTATLERENAVLRARERAWREILQSLPAAVYTTDAEGRIDFYNEAAAALSGRRPQIGIDRWCITWQLYTPDGRLRQGACAGRPEPERRRPSCPYGRRFRARFSAGDGRKAGLGARLDARARDAARRQLPRRRRPPGGEVHR